MVIREPLDRSVLAAIDQVIVTATEAFEDLDYARALATIEPFFWTFCDDYVELVKARAYAGDESAIATLADGLDVLLRLLAPFLPFVTEEVWSWWRDGSIHRAAWPEPGPADGDPGLLAAAGHLLSAIRRTKRMRDEVATVTIPAGTPGIERLAELSGDLRAAAHAGVIAPG